MRLVFREDRKRQSPSLSKALAAPRGGHQRVAGGLQVAVEPLDEQQSGASAGRRAHELQGARTRVGAALEDECRAAGSRDGLHAAVRDVSDEQCGGVVVGAHVPNGDSVFSGEAQRVEFAAARQRQRLT